MVLGYAVTLGATWGRWAARRNRTWAIWSTTPRRPPSSLPPRGDSLVPVKNSLAFAGALADHDIPFALHVFPTGGHGLSLASPCTCGGDSDRVNAEAAALAADERAVFARPLGGAGRRCAQPGAGRPDGRRSAGLDVPFRRLLKNPAAAAVLRRRLPEVLPILQQNPLFAGASLRQLTGFMPEAYSEEFLNAVDAELAACQQPPQPES